MLVSACVFIFALFVSSHGTNEFSGKTASKTDKYAVDAGNVLGGEDSKVNEATPAPLPSFSSLLEETSKPEVPADIKARSYVVYDVRDDKILAGKNADLALPPASTTKIMTAIVTLEDYDLQDVVEVPNECVGVEGTNVGFKAGEAFTIESLLYGLLLPSASDAACTLARADGNAYDFLAQMNRKAQALGLEHTNFEGVIGLDSEKHVSSARDLVKIAKYALLKWEFGKIVGASQKSIYAHNSENVYSVINTNELLGLVPGTIGVKTGYTEKAQGCLVYAYENKSDSIIIVVMGSKERFNDTKKLLYWALDM